MAAVHRVVVRLLHPFVQNLFHLVGVVIVHGGGAQRVADEFHDIMVALDPGIAAEDR